MEAPMKPITQQIQQVEKLLAEVSAHHWEAALELFTGETPFYEDVPSNTRLTGRSGISGVYQELATAMPNLMIEVTSAADVPGCSIREILIVGTHKGVYQGVPPTGRSIRLACACFFHFDAGGKLLTQRMYFDNQTLVRQMRGEVEPYLPKRLRVAA